MAAKTEYKLKVLEQLYKLVQIAYTPIASARTNTYSIYLSTFEPHLTATELGQILSTLESERVLTIKTNPFTQPEKSSPFGDFDLNFEVELLLTQLSLDKLISELRQKSKKVEEEFSIEQVRNESSLLLVCGKYKVYSSFHFFYNEEQIMGLTPLLKEILYYILQKQSEGKTTFNAEGVKIHLKNPSSMQTGVNKEPEDYEENTISKKLSDIRKILKKYYSEQPKLLPHAPKYGKHVWKINL